MKNMLLNGPSRQRLAAPRLLVIGCGDVGMRLLPRLRGHFRIFALTSSRQRFDELRQAGAVPILGDLDQAHTLARLGRLARRIVHLAPPASHGEHDSRSRRLVAILPEGSHMVYVSTTGVYGNCQGAQIDEARPVAPVNARARRRVDAERVLRAWASRSGSRLSILRVPGIYAEDRLPIERLQRGTPALVAEDDVYTNHIHADDLARIIRLALVRGLPQRIYHAVDDSELKMGDYFDLVADAKGLPRPPRLARAQLKAQVTPMMLSFMSESRRLDNLRIKRELGVRLQWPDVQSFLSRPNRP
jgi:nucleoside-diphosphate-sugar epimerase